jgi:hypothetical protein
MTTLTKDFLTAGCAIFTVEPSYHFNEVMRQLGRESSDHYTFRIESNNTETLYFVQLLTGPDNTSDYTYVGLLNVDQGSIHKTKASQLPFSSTPVQIAQRVLQRIFANEGDKITEQGWKVHHAGRCGRCGRTLTTPDSCESGIGPECRKILNRS